MKPLLQNRTIKILASFQLGYSQVYRQKSRKTLVLGLSNLCFILMGGLKTQY